ncbi:MAG TPA: ABC transporter permease [Candidatus Anammoximicrobium sp.]|nr:ABC transporter permease [Candidatus Anammoximicrobium sp.]
MTSEVANPICAEATADTPTTGAPTTDHRSPTTDHRSPWTTVIRPRRSLLDLRLGELWQCRDLISLFVWRDFVAIYKQTILGPLWHIIQPLLTTVTFTVIFGQVAQLSTDGAPQFLFYMSGTVIWMYFSTCLTKTATTFVANAGLYGKVYFHRLSIPISVVISNLISFAIQFAVFLVFLGLYAARGQAVAPNAWILLTPLLLLMLAGLGLGFGIIVSALTTRYRDLVQLVAFGVQLWMYATPVVYPVSIVPARFQWVLLINPVAPIVESFRYAFLGSGAVSLPQLAYSAAFTAAVLAVGTILFNRVEQTFMDTV